MILRLFYLHNRISYTGKTTSLLWIRAQDSIVKWQSPVSCADLDNASANCLSSSLAVLLSLACSGRSPSLKNGVSEPVVPMSSLLFFRSMVHWDEKKHMEELDLHKFSFKAALIEATRFVVRIARSLWNWTGVSAAPHDNLNNQSCGFKTSQILTIRCLIRHWNGPLATDVHLAMSQSYLC